MDVMQHVLKQKEKAEAIIRAEKAVIAAESELEKMNIFNVIRGYAKVNVAKYGDTYEREIQFDITLSELAILLQRRVDKSKEKLNELLNEF